MIKTFQLLKVQSDAKCVYGTKVKRFLIVVSFPVSNFYSARNRLLKYFFSNMCKFANLYSVKEDKVLILKPINCKKDNSFFVLF